MTLVAEETTPFGEWVLTVLREHGATYRSQRIRTGLPHSTVVNWVKGAVPPNMEGVIQFARGFGEDVNAALKLAGHVVTDDWLNNRAPADDVISHLLDLADTHPQELTWEPEADELTIHGIHGDVSPETRERLEKILRATYSEERRRQGRE